MKNAFYFRKFLIQQTQCAQKVCSDTIVLGAWTAAPSVRPLKVLDVGTGSGVLALMLAQRFPAARIDAVEIHAEAAAEAARNFQTSPWPERLNAICSAISDFQPSDRYDVIVANPPWFQNVTRSFSARRSAARHTSSLSFQQLLSNVDRLLSDDGYFSALIADSASAEFLELADGHSLFCHRQCTIAATPQHSASSVLFELRRTRPSRCTVPEPLHMRSGDSLEYSDSYNDLVREFYLRYR